jgi:hypothetical protein
LDVLKPWIEHKSQHIMTPSFVQCMHKRNEGYKNPSQMSSQVDVINYKAFANKLASMTLVQITTKDYW